MLSKLLDAQWQGREEIFTSLCFYFKDYDIETIYRELFRRGDVESIYWLIRYLVFIERPLGFEKLFLLAQDENEIIRKEAASGIARISDRAGEELFLRVMKGRWKDGICFAAGHLGKLRQSRAVIPLLDALEKYSGDEKICLSIIKALGNLRDKRSLSVMEQFADEEEGQVQQEALIALSKITDGFHLKYLRRWLHSDNRRIKEQLYLTLLRQKDKRWEKYIAGGLLREKDESLKSIVLLSLRQIRTEELLRVVFELAASDPSLKVRMMAQSFLREAKSRSHFKWFVRQEGKSPPGRKALLFTLLAEYTDEPVTFEIFRQTFLTSRDEKLKLMALRSCGSVKDGRPIPFLMKIIKEDDSYCYAAAISLSDKITPEQWPLVEEILSLTPDRRGLCIQVFLKFLLRIPYGYAFPDGIIKKVDDLAAADSPDIRYLVTRCLSRFHKTETMDRLLRIAGDDRESSVRTAAIEGLIEIVDRYPTVLIPILQQGIHKKMLLPGINRILKGIKGSAQNFKPILETLLTLIGKHLYPSGEYRKMNRDSRRGMVLLRHHIIKQKQVFLQYLANTRMEDQDLWVLVKVMNATDICRMRGACVDFMARHYKKASLLTKVECLEFFGKMRVKSVCVENAVFEDLSCQTHEVLEKQVQMTVAGWIK